MTTALKGREVTATGRTAEWVPKAVALGAIGVVVAAVALKTAVVGAGSDARIANPHPVGRVLVDGVPRPEPGLWGISNWSAMFGIAFLVVASIALAIMVAQSVRARRVSVPLMVFGAVALLASLDPPANWVTFTIYNPQLVHFPTTWAWMRLSPGVEPLLVVPGYPFYYFTIALASFTIGRRWLLPRLSPASWWGRHPRIVLAGIGFVVANAWDFPMELLMLRARMYTYSEWFGPSIHIGKASPGLPVIWTLATTVTIAAITTLFYRDRGEASTMSVLGVWLPRIRPAHTEQPTGQSAGRQILAGALVLGVVYLAIMGFFGALRVAGSDTRTPRGGLPYGELKTYDPYGTLHTAGLPGPYYK
jgi:hypothetical protein